MKYGHVEYFEIFHKQENFTVGWYSDVIWSHGELFHLSSLNSGIFCVKVRKTHAHREAWEGSALMFGFNKVVQKIKSEPHHEHRHSRCLLKNPLNTFMLTSRYDQ